MRAPRSPRALAHLRPLAALASLALAALALAPLLATASLAAPAAPADPLARAGLTAGPLALPEYRPGAGLTALPVLRWTRPLPGLPPASASRSEPAGVLIDGDRLYTGYSGSDALLVLSRRDGTLIRELPAHGPVSSAPVRVGDDLFYADAAGYTSCYDLRADQLRWDRYNGAPVLASPVVRDGAVYLSNVDDQVYALDAATGELRWRYAHRVATERVSRLTLYSAPAPTVDGDQILAGFSDGQVVAIGLSDGAERWSVPIGEGAWPDITAPAVLAGDSGQGAGQGGGRGVIVVGGYSGPLVALDRQSRSLLWRLEIGSSSAPLVDGEWIYHGGADGRLRRINARTGAETWSWQADIPGLSFLLGEGGDAERTTSGTLGSPQMTDQGLLIGNSDGSIYLIDPETGAQRWGLDPGHLLSGFLAPPAASGSDIFAVSNHGVLYALRGEARKGKI